MSYLSTATLTATMPEPVGDDAWRVDLGRVGPARVNAYLLRTGAGPVAIDAGFGHTVDELEDAIRATGQDPAELQAVLVTHTDPDHVGGLAQLTAGTDARVHLSSTAAAILTGQHELPWLNTKGIFQRAAEPFVDEVEPARMAIVEEGDLVHGLRVVATPGHGLGHLAYVREADGLVFLGDLVRMTRGKPHIAPGFINYDTGQARESLGHLLDVIAEPRVACSGHGPPLREDARVLLERLVG